jgi:hypothetical protein
LDGLSHLHLFAGEADEIDLGTSTALLTHAADLLRAREDPCDADCPAAGSGHHRHLVISIGRGLLGLLEELADDDEETGIRVYDRSVEALRKLGRTGGLTTVFLPALLGDPSACNRFTLRQHRLLQALQREMTRAKRPKRGDPVQPEVLDGNSIPSISGRGLQVCPLLDATQRYAGFTGNKRRRWLGYRLTTPNGWLAKAGYERSELGALFADLGVLAQRLELTVVGLRPANGGFLDLSQMQSMTASPRGRAQLNSVHVRVFAPADYLDRWSKVFDWEAGQPSDQGSLADELFAVLRHRKLSQRSLAHQLGVDPSWFNKLMHGHNSWPSELEERARRWIVGGPVKSSS